MASTRPAFRPPRGLTDPDVEEVRRPRLPSMESDSPFGLSDSTVWPAVSVPGGLWGEWWYMFTTHRWELAETRRQLAELIHLPADWDGYGGVPVRQPIAEFVMSLLHQLVADHAMFPQLIPTSDGGLNMEWHAHSRDLLIAIEPDEPVLVFYEDRSTDTVWERELSSAIPDLDAAIASFAPSAE